MTTDGKKVGIYFPTIAQERHQGRAGARKEKKTSVTNELSAQPSALIREEDFAKQLRLARYLAGASLPPSRRLETHLKARTPKQVRPLAKARRRTKAASRGQKAGEAELAKERRRTGRPVQGTPSSGPRRGEKPRPSPERSAHLEKPLRPCCSAKVDACSRIVDQSR